ncbi:uncharacterized protein K02A2.6-like [Haliotis rufescens]|uniref:uncharacterized protein K02A2.6-like n=1 Tax=Haliotis rufescens TaxID=6454 RepID=UPI00201F5C88|nr:uncharacterized protein K02A2.6-like [Haliotis rufescens]
MDSVALPKLNWSSDEIANDFRLFKQRCKLYFSVKNIKNDKQVDHILLFTGDDGLKAFNSWTLTEEEAKDPQVIFKKFEAHLEPRSNFRVQRFYLQRYRQDTLESVDNYMTRCKLQAFKCRFGEAELKERLIEQLIIGTRIPELQKELLGKDEQMSLDQAMDIARVHEASINNMAQLQGVQTTKTDIHQVRKEQPCKYCGRQHPPNRCPAYGSECENCGIRNHWKVMCRRNATQHTPYRGRARGNSRGRGRGQPHTRRPHRGRSRSRQGQRSVNSMTGNDDLDFETAFETLTFESLSIDAILNDRDTRDEVFVTLNISLEDRPQQAATLKAKVDTGAQGNLLPLRIYQRMYPNTLDSNGKPNANSTKQSSTILRAYNGTRIAQYGKISLPCTFNGHTSQADFFISGEEGPAILGLPTCRQLRVVTLNCEIKDSPPKQKVDGKEDLIRSYPDRFQGIGQFKKECHITVDPSVPPMIHAPRRCPIHLKDEIKAELDEMEKIKVIAKVTEPTDWVSSLAYSRKASGKLRVCLDPKDLNTAIKRPHYKTPTLEEITHKFSGATVFSKLDARHGYWSVKLDEESSMLTTFNSPFGRYRFLRLPFGLNLSQDVFQKSMDMILEKCPGTVGIADDIAVFGKNKKEHDNNLINLMEAAQQSGLVFNPGKCEIKTDQIKFFGLVFDAEGVHADPDKVKAIREIGYPSDAKQLQEFLGIATYMGPFIPHLSQITAPLRELIKKDVEYKWSESHQSSFNKIKETICKKVTLTYFNPTLDSTLRVDASMKGLGAVLLQNEKPIAFASKSLSETEQRYANIEREMLAVVFGCERFHTYLYGKQFIVETDHKPLEMIHLKNLSAAPQRLQRMLLRVQPYDVTIKYRPGSMMEVADALSRSPGKTSKTIDLDIRVDLTQFSDKKIQSLKEETSKDATLQALKEIILEGWPERPKQLPAPIRPYWAYRDELSIEDGLLLKGDCVIIPTSMKQEILGKLHEAHQGIEKTKLRAKTCVFWCGIGTDIENMVKSCHVCQEFQKCQPAEPLLQHELPTRPWQVLGTDLFYMEGEEYIIVSDYYSKFPIIRKMSGGSRGTISTLKAIFAEQGIPEKVISDNGPHFSAERFQEFAKAWGFTHITSSPHYPQSNGFIERQIQTTKRTLQKAKLSNIDPNMAMLILRATPIDHNLPSPAELLNTRKMKSNLPMRVKNHNTMREDVRRHLEERQLQQKEHFDNRAGEELPPLIPNQPISVRDQQSGRWKNATIVGKSPEPRSYIVETTEGSILRRNRRDLREITEEKRNTSAAPLEPLRQGNQSTSPHQNQRRVSFNPKDNKPSTNKQLDKFEKRPTTTTSQGHCDPSSETVVCRTRAGREVRRPKHLNE